MNRQDIANHADDNTPNVRGKNIGEIVTLLEVTSCVFSKCLSGISFQRNDCKFHVLLSPGKLIQVNTGTIQIENNRCEKLLRVVIDGKLSFENQN